MVYILVVLYNRSLESSDTLKGILDSADFLKNINAFVFIWDNSEEKALSNKDITILTQKLSLSYYHCPSNKPLAEIYNEVFHKLSLSGEYKYLAIFDHDSNVSLEYFKELSYITQSYNTDIILPVAKNNGIIISPAKLYFVKGNYFKVAPKGIYKGKLLAVNSGMAISLAFIKKNNFKYDYRLKNYGTDNYLMNFANSKETVYYIMNSSFEHGYSFYDHDDLYKKAEVFKQIKRANKIAFSLNIIQSVMINLYNLFASLKNAIKYKSLKFFS
jgi:hypothetical protein